LQSNLLSNRAIAIAVLLVIIVGLIAGLGTIGYIIAGRKVKQPFIRFMVRYAIVFIFLILLEVTFLRLVPSVHETLRNAMASFVGRALSLAGVSHTVAGSLITVEDPTLSFSIDVGCLGGVLFWVYVALVLAESGLTLRQRLIGLVVGLVILIAFNFFRVSISIYLEWLTGVNVHDYFYLFNVIFVLLVWAGWLRTLKPKAGAPATLTPSR